MEIKTHYLVLKPVVLEIEGKIIKDIHQGNIFLSYYNFEDALKESENGKYKIYELEINNKNTLY